MLMMDLLYISNNYSDDIISFQNGVDIIYNGCVTYGSTPTSKTPNAIVTAISNIYTNRYNNGVTDGTPSNTSKVTISLSLASGDTSGNKTVTNTIKGIKSISGSNGNGKQYIKSLSYTNNKFSYKFCNSSDNTYTISVTITYFY